jgi:hypothetical protein
MSSSSSSTSSSSSSGNSSSSSIGEKRQRTDDIQNTPKIPNVEEEEECPICLAPLGTTDIKKLDKVVINGEEVCGHSFHKDCIDKWIDSTRRQQGGPKCPVCRTEIKPEQRPQSQPRGPTIVQQARRDAPSVRAASIQAEQQQRQSIVPFMGILVCLNGQPFQKKYLNSDQEFALNINSTLGDLKRQLLALAPQFASERTYFCQTNMGRDINNALSITGLTNYREPSFKITNMYFGTPYSCDNISQLNTGIENMISNDNRLDNRTLIDIYKDYQYNILYASEILGNRYSILSSICYRHIIRWNPTGHEDPGYYDTDYFVNINNPVIPEEFRARPRTGELSDFQHERSTRYPLAWLVVNIQCNTLTRPINNNNNTGLVTNTLQQDPNQRPGGGGYAGGKIKTRNKHYRHKKSVRKTSGRNKKSIRRQIKLKKKSVRKY